MTWLTSPGEATVGVGAMYRHWRALATSWVAYSQSCMFTVNYSLFLAKCDIDALLNSETPCCPKTVNYSTLGLSKKKQLTKGMKGNMYNKSISIYSRYRYFFFFFFSMEIWTKVEWVRVGECVCATGSVAFPLAHVLQSWHLRVVWHVKCLASPRVYHPSGCQEKQAVTVSPASGPCAPSSNLSIPAHHGAPGFA